ncbi:hypothetical protein LCGC14_0429890 [marine sediment metagenome]|uniref:Band 7 domain-containing protein n=1 Tax=marine sediment metagenome TaxID=412755 RepID=A0A0F9VXW1_9ZZZZ
MVIFLGIVGFILFILSIVGAFWVGLDKSGTYKFKGWTVLIPIIGFVVFFYSVSSPIQVNAGERAVLLDFGAVTDTIFDEGLHFKTPIKNSIVKLDVTTQAFVAEASAASKDLQTVTTDVTANYRLDPESVNDTYQEYKKAYEFRVVVPGVQESVKAITAQFNAEELITRRPEVKLAIEEALRVHLQRNGMFLENLSITNFQFSESFDAAIDAKQVAEQDALKAENLLRQIEVEARQDKQRAEGQRDAAIAEAQGQAQAITLVADAQASANDVISASLTDQLIQWRTVDQLSDNISVIVLPTGQEFILGPEVLGR